METLLTKKITKATVKKFIKDNFDKLYINVKSDFCGMTDSIQSCNEGFKKATSPKLGVPIEESQTLGVEGAWFVGNSRDYFSPFENIAKDMIGIEVSNSCGSFVLAIYK